MMCYVFVFVYAFVPKYILQKEERECLVVHQ